LSWRHPTYRKANCQVFVFIFVPMEELVAGALMSSAHPTDPVAREAAYQQLNHLAAHEPAFLSALIVNGDPSPFRSPPHLDGAPALPIVKVTRACVFLTGSGRERAGSRGEIFGSHIPQEPHPALLVRRWVSWSQNESHVSLLMFALLPAGPSQRIGRTLFAVPCLSSWPRSKCRYSLWSLVSAFRFLT